MEKKELFLLLDELFELSPGTTKEQDSVDELDSIVVIGLIALADERFGKSLSVTEIENCRTVDDIVALLI